MLERMWSRGNPPTLLVEMYMGTATMENRMEIPQKTKISITISLSNLTPGSIPKQNCNSKIHLYPRVHRNVLSGSVVSDSVTPWTIICQALLSMGFSRQEYWSGLPFILFSRESS